MDLANFRTKKHKRGWVAEYKKPYWTPIGIFYKWRHFISVSGIDEKPWYFADEKFAEDELLKQIRYDVIKNSRM